MTTPKSITLADWEKKNKTHSLSDEFLAVKLLTMKPGEFDTFVEKVREARANVKSKKEALDFAKTLAKDVIIPMVINSTKK